MCRDMYRVMPYAYPPVTGGQHGGAGTDPGSTHDLPYDFSNFSVVWEPIIGKTQGAFSHGDKLVNISKAAAISGLIVINSEIAATSRISVTGTSTELKFDVYNNGSKVDSKTTGSPDFAINVANSKLFAIYNCFTNPYSYPDAYVKVTNEPTITISAIKVYDADGKILQEWTP